MTSDPNARSDTHHDLNETQNILTEQLRRAIGDNDTATALELHTTLQKIEAIEDRRQHSVEETAHPRHLMAGDSQDHISPAQEALNEQLRLAIQRHDTKGALALLKSLECLENSEEEILSPKILPLPPAAPAISPQYGALPVINEAARGMQRLLLGR